MKPIGMPVERLDMEDRGVPSWVRAQHLRRYAWAASLVASKDVLDVACGTGYGARLMARAGAKRVLGMDIDRNAVAMAASNAHDARCEFQVGDATSLPLGNAIFDAVVSFETIEHVQDDEAYLREMRRVLRDDGMFVCSTPNRAVMNPGRSLTEGSFNPHHVREYAEDEFRERLGAHFRQVTILGQSSYSRRYVDLLTRAAAITPLAAVRLHQVQKLMTSLWRKADYHDVRGYPSESVPEFFVACCQA
jgi:ubiquinone/menaquinone biosynthesis C-methylase UbiE